MGRISKRANELIFRIKYSTNMELCRLYEALEKEKDNLRKFADRILYETRERISRKTDSEWEYYFLMRILLLFKDPKIVNELKKIENYF